MNQPGQLISDPADEPASAGAGGASSAQGSARAGSPSTPVPFEPVTTPTPDFDPFASTLPPGSHEPTVGEKVAEFRLLSVLGAGGFGTVFHGKDTKLGRKVAVKVLKASAFAHPAARAEFLKEAQAAAQFQHDHVTPIFRADEAGGVLFIVMPLLAGETLASRLNRKGALPPDEVRRIGAEAARVLAALHAKRFVHRDIKPANLWLEADTGRVKILDLGMAYVAQSAVAAHGGTPSYMSPEQVRGDPLDGRSDLFSLGSVLYEAATGVRPFVGGNLGEIVQAVCEAIPRPPAEVNPALPADLAKLIVSLLEKEPAQRPASAEDVAQRLQPAAPNPKNNRLLLVASAMEIASLAAALLTAVLWGSPGLGGSNHPPEPVTIESLQVHHFEALAGEKVRAAGVVGQDSFTPHLGDEITVAARLSRPAYAYILLFRPDGEAGLLYPQDEDDIPSLTATPHYPAKRRSERYYLEEGAGLWVVSLVVSESPLPAYRDWRASHAGPAWRHAPGKPGAVWWDDGQLFHLLESGQSSRGSKTAPDLAPLARLTDELRAQIPGAVQALGFTVQ